MAFTVTMLSWGTIEYGNQLNKAGELENVEAAIKWGADYLLKAHTGPTELYVQVHVTHMLGKDGRVSPTSSPPINLSLV